MTSCFIFFFFFFQAEDGIRDATVTGVQTCALPIYRYILNHGAFSDGRYNEENGGNNLLRFFESQDLVHWTYVYEIPIDTRFRSEERRVGKECRIWLCG